MMPPSIEAVGSGVDGLKQNSKACSEQRRWPDGRMVQKKGSAPKRGGKSAEVSEKNRDKHDQYERVEGRNGSVPNKEGWYRGTTRTHSQA